MPKEKAAGGGQASSVPLFLLFPHESLRWIRVGALSPLQTPLKRPRRGLRPPFLGFSPGLGLCGIYFRIYKTRCRCVLDRPARLSKYSASVSTSIRQIFNGRKKSDLHGLSCAWETRLDGRPKGVLTTETKRQNARQNDKLFRRVSAISRPASLFCILFSDKPEKSMSAKRYRTNWVQKGGCNAIPARISRRAVGPQSH